MAIVKPFKALRYNKEKVSNIAEAIVPPYDVISPAELQDLRKGNAYNYSAVILPKNGQYSESAKTLKAWKEEAVLIQDSKPTLYFYKQTFTLTPQETFCLNLPQSIKEGGKLSRTGILCRVGLEDYSSKIILPHEKTFSGPKADRYKLMEAVQGNMEPVFLGYESKRFSGDEFEKICLGKKPEYDFTDKAGIHHQLWLISDPAVLGEVEKVLDGQKFYILDGHHRYETALQFYKDHKNRDAHLDHRYVLANICSFDQPGTVILPTHRALNGQVVLPNTKPSQIKNVDTEKFLRDLEANFQVTSGLTVEELEQKLLRSTMPAFGLNMKNNPRCYLLEYKEDRKGRLDLEILHEEVLSQFSEEEISYIKDVGVLMGGITWGEYQMGFLVRPSTNKEVMDVASKGHVMPHKSTFFYPKIPSGLVINIFE